MNRFRARLFSAVVLALFVTASVAPAVATAQSTSLTTFWFAGTRLIFDSPVALDGDIAVSLRDSGLQRLLARTGATLAYQPQSRYVLITSADRRVIALTVGDASYSVAGVFAKAAFAPFFDASDVIVPLYAIARALYVQPITVGGETVLEPQIGALDVRPDGRRTVVTLRGATALRYVKLSETPERLTVTFPGVGSALAASRQIGSGIAEVDVAVGGTPKNPSATLTIVAPPGQQHLIAGGTPPAVFSVVFAPPGVALDLNVQTAGAPAGVDAQRTAAVLAPLPAPTAPGAPPGGSDTVAAAPTPQTGPATVTTVAIERNADGGMTVRLQLDGTATYDWHRLRDERWYLDIADAALTDAARDEHPGAGVVDAVRVRQIGSAAAPIVRVAFSLRGDRHIDVTPATGLLTIVVGSESERELGRTGNGQIGGATVAQTTAQSPAGPPVAPIAPEPQETPWKFAPVNGPADRIIVIDPGHGGADAGTAHNGLVEKRLTLDISLRLRTLLTQQGWNVRLTRDSDIDPVSAQTLAAFAGDGRPNSTDRAYLQTRCDVANAAGARLFISIHVNYADSSAVHGTTFYYTKPQDVPFAQALERSMIPALGTQDDGVVKSNLYVTKHTTMPAVLIETGFISNPGDVRLLGDPNFLQAVAVGIAAGVKAYAGALPALSSTLEQ